MKLRYIVSLALAACLVLLAACGGAEVPSSPPPESPASVSEAPPEPASPAAPAPEAGVSQPASQPEPEPPALTPAPGVEVKTLLTWEPGSRRVEVPFPVRDERLLVETRTQTGQWTETGLTGFDLTTGEEFAIPLAKFDGFEYRQVLDAPGWEIKIFSETSYQRLSRTQSLDGYTLPESLWEGRKIYSGKHDWDAQPEKDLLTWTGPEGLWLAAADGSGARLVLTTEQILKHPRFSYLAERCKDLPEETALTFQCPRLMNGGKTVVVDFDLPGSPTGHIGLAVLKLATGRAAWYDPFANPLWGGLEYLDDVTVQAGDLQINVATGKTKGASRHIQVGDPYFVATTGDFSRYFACTAEEGLAVFSSSSAGWKSKTALTATGYRKLSLCHAIDGRRVVCEYETPGEAGLLLVTVPEPPSPEPVPDPVLTVSPGVECKTLLTWDGAEKEITLGPLCLENKQILLETAGDKRNALGLDLETGAIDFTLPLEEDSYLREVLGEPGEFLVMGRTGCRHYVWREDGWLGEYPAYDLPEQAREAIKGYESDFDCRFFWDILPEENLLAWTAADGVWLAEADGSNARLAISAKEVFENPDFDDMRATYPYLFSDPNPGSEYGPLLVEPCFMDGGKKLTVVEYVLTPIINHGEGYGLIVFDIPSGETERHGPRITNGFFELEYLDERTILTGEHKMDVRNGTFETFKREHCYVYPKGWGFSADGAHFFTSYNTGKASQLIRYSLDGSNNDYGFFDKKIEAGQAKILLDLENSYVHGETPVNGNQVLCFWAPFTTSPDQTTRLLLVTAPD